VGIDGCRFVATAPRYDPGRPFSLERPEAMGELDQIGWLSLGDVSDEHLRR